MYTEAFNEYVHSGGFLGALGLGSGTELSFSPLGQGEYNVNYMFVHPVTGQKLVLRVNTGSQMHLDDQIEYEFSALRDLEPSGRTPRPVFCDGTRSILPYGVLVMEWLPGRPLRYESDLETAAHIFADIHSMPIPADTRLLRPSAPASAIYDECLEMAEHYFSWERSDPAVCRLLRTLADEIGGRLAASGERSGAGVRCIVNTEVNSGNFLINDGGKSFLIDWEKPLISEPAQDLAHFLVPTTTFWRTDTMLTADDIVGFVNIYRTAVGDRLDLSELPERLPLFFTVTCLRGVSWCAMAMREYSRPDRPLSNAETLAKLKVYLSEDFLRNILENYVRSAFLKGGTHP